MVINKSIKYSLCVYNFSNCIYADITFRLASIDWCSLFNNLRINDAVNLFNSIVYETIDIFVFKIIKRQSTYTLWFGKNFKDLIKKKKSCS